MPGLARERLEQDSGVFQIYFSGCAGDLTMGKYDAGTPKDRATLAVQLTRLAESLRQTAILEERNRVAGGIERCRPRLPSKVVGWHAWKGHGKRVNVISPGLTDTPAYRSMPAEQRQAMFRQVAESLPARRMGQPEDIARAVLYLMADPYATGTILLIDGGFVLR